MERAARAWVADSWAWIGEAVRPLATIAVGLGAVGWTASATNRIWVLPALVVLGWGCTRYAEVSQAAHREAHFHHRRGRIAVSLLLAVVALALPIMGSGIRRDLAPSLQSAGDFTGVGALLLGLGGLVAELRLLTRWRGRRGPAALVVAGVAFLGCLVVDPTSGLLVGLLVVAVLAGALGTEMLSEDLLDEAAWPVAVLPLLPWAGAAVLAIGAGAFVLLGVAPVSALVVLALLTGLTWLVSTRSDNLLLTLVVAGALLWAGAPRTTDVAAVAKPNKSLYFAVFGDSYISGEGASVFQDGTNTKTPNADHDNQCRRANTSWPILLADARVDGVPHHVLDVACSGAVASQLFVDPPPGPGHVARELDLFRRARPGFGRTVTTPSGTQDHQPEFAVVSIGGNDALFSVIGQTCVAPGSCTEFAPKLLASLDALPAKLDRAYRDLSTTLGPDVPVIAVPYPDPIAAEATACPGVLLDAGERSFIHQYLQGLDQQIEAAAGRAGFHYMDTMVGALADGGSRLCEGSGRGRGLNFIAVHPQGGSVADLLEPTNWTHNSMHPNEEGHRLMRAAAERWFDDHPVASLTPPHPVVLDEAALVRSVARKPTIVPSDWLPNEAQGLARRMALPVLVTLFGAWLLLIVRLGAMARSGWSAAGKLHEAGSWLRRPPR